MGAGAIGLQVQILLLELVFHVATRTVKLFIALLGAEALRRLAGLMLKTIDREIGHNKARVVFVLEYLGFSDDSSRTCPTFKSLILDFGEAACHLATENGRLTHTSKLCFY